MREVAMSGSAEMQMQMQMDSGQLTGFPSQSALVRPFGISPSVHITKPGEWYQGNRWPPLSMLKDADLERLPDKDLTEWALSELGIKDGLPGRQWSAQFYAIAVLGEFVRQEIAAGLESEDLPNEDKEMLKIEEPKDPEKPKNLVWDRVELDPEALLRGPANASGSYLVCLTSKLECDANPAGISAEAVKAELYQLAQLMDYRPNVLAEALAQRNGIDTYFRGILSFTQTSHPLTFGLMQIALRTGELQAIHYKYQFNRPRASTLAPWLMPPIEVPGHASFPSGHSTQSHLVALVLGEVMPTWARGKNGPLRQLAMRIARNREVLGLHYPSDSKAGEKLAMGSFLLLRKCGTVQAMIEAARKEWDVQGRPKVSSLHDLGYDAS
jgi:hypothetical protein